MNRKIKPELKKFFDCIVHADVGPPLFDPKKFQDFNRVVSLLALSCVGIKETGDNQGDFVELFQATVGSAQKEPWCAAFVQSIIAYIEETTLLKSKIVASESCFEMLTQSKGCLVDAPRTGDIIVWLHDGTTKGHVGIIYDIVVNVYGKPEFYLTVEGNTGDGNGTIVREGDGVYIRKRKVGGSASMIEKGFLRAFAT